MAVLNRHMEVYVEKISHIIRGNARVGVSDTNKMDRATRPGAPTFGRRDGVDSKAQDEAAKKAAGHDSLTQQSESFFMSRARGGPATAQVVTAPEQAAPVVHEMELVAKENAHDEIEELAGPREHEIESIQPSGFVPRGSFVNVHA